MKREKREIGIIEDGSLHTVRSVRISFGFDGVPEKYIRIGQKLTEAGIPVQIFTETRTWGDLPYATIDADNIVQRSHVLLFKGTEEVDHVLAKMVRSLH